MSEVLLGLPGDLIAADDLTPWATKAGGCPCVFSQVPEAVVLRRAHCIFCGSPLSLVLQACAPLPASADHLAVPDRILLLLMCTSSACSTAPHAFQALRVQLVPASKPTPTPLAEPPRTQPQPFEAVAWDTPSHSTPAPRDDAAQAFDFSDLMADLDDLEASSSASAAVAQQPAKARPAVSAPANAHLDSHNEPCTSCASTQALGGPELPEFWVEGQREPSAPSAAPASSTSADRDHISELLERYREEERQALASAQGGATDSGTTATGEAYEGSDAYQKFLKRVARQPHQCVRYGIGLPVLWPSADVPVPPRCPHCGAERSLELQVMSPLWHFMEEALSWYDAAHQAQHPRVSASVLQQPAWDWVTVGIWTCARACSGGDAGKGWSVAEEHVAGVNLGSGHVGRGLHQLEDALRAGIDVEALLAGGEGVTSETQEHSQDA